MFRPDLQENTHLILVLTSVIPFHYIVLLLAMRLFPWASLITSQEFEELPPMPPVVNVGDSGTLYLSRVGGDSGMG